MAHPKLSAFTAAAVATDSGRGAHPNLSAFGSAGKKEFVTSHDTDPSDRCADRLLARLGFGSAAAVPRAGVLLALPVLIASGAFECAQKIYGSLGPAFSCERPPPAALASRSCEGGSIAGLAERRTWKGARDLRFEI